MMASASAFLVRTEMSSLMLRSEEWWKRRSFQRETRVGLARAAKPTPKRTSAVAAVMGRMRRGSSCQVKRPQRMPNR